jgi:hypothetical protein
VTSSAIAAPIPTPICWTWTSVPEAKDPITTSMISAALVMMRPVCARP